MATLTLKNVPDELYEELKAEAAAHDRSLNREAIMLLKLGLAQAGARSGPEEVIARLRRFRESLPEAARAVTMEEIDAWKREGRK